MAFENDTNRGRVQKMIEILTLIEKSGQSNQASPEAMAEMLRPLADHLAGLGVEAPEEIVRTHAPTIKAPAWASVREMAEEADLHDLSVALAIYMNRVDEALSELSEDGPDV